MSDQNSSLILPGEAPASPPAWCDVCLHCNALSAERESWWARIVFDPEVVPRVDDSGVTMRLRGNDFAQVRLGGAALQCRIDPEHLLLSHPGARTVLGAVEATPQPRLVQNLAELASHYEHVRRRVCRHTDRRQEILDRLFLRHPCVLAVDAPLPSGRADLVALSAQGEAVFYLLRRYSDGDLRLRGRGGIAWRMGELERWLADEAAATAWVRDVLERSGALRTPHSRRYASSRISASYPHARLLIVDFDHAQRLSGLPQLRADITADLHAALDRTAVQSDIHCIGDPGNISYTTFFSGI